MSELDSCFNFIDMYWMYFLSLHVYKVAKVKLTVQELTDQMWIVEIS